MSNDGPPSTVELHLARPGEAEIVSRLAALDSAPRLEGEVLLALLDGAAVAALSLADRRVVADPFVPTSEVVAVLRLRAEHLLRPDERGKRRLRGRRRRLRLA